jgi:hypothetical protein
MMLDAQHEGLSLAGGVQTARPQTAGAACTARACCCMCGDVLRSASHHLDKERHVDAFSTARWCRAAAPGSVQDYAALRGT